MLLGIECELTNLVHGNLFALLALYTAHDSINAHHELFHREWLGDVIVGTNLETLENVFFKRFGSEEDYGDFAVDGADFLCELETVFLGHHDVEHANVVLALEEGLVAALAIGIEVGIVALGL